MGGFKKENFTILQEKNSDSLRMADIYKLKLTLVVFSVSELCCKHGLLDQSRSY